MPVLNIQALINDRVEAIQKYHADAGVPRAELDVSGGIDSAVMLMLLARALGPDNITAAYSSINSSTESRDRARLVAKAADVKLLELELSEIFEAIGLEAMRAFGAAGFDTDLIVKFMEGDASVDGSLRSTLRAPIGRYLNRMSGGGIRHGTGNEDEDRWLRFYQKGGDGEVDCNALAFLSKGEVYQLAVALGVPKEIIEALPTPDLWGTGDKHNDEDELTRLSGVDWTYSRVNPTTGEYVRVGTIERMSRFQDTLDNFQNLFNSEAAMGPEKGILDRLVELAAKFGLTRKHLESARHWERITRHKMNPNCPDLAPRGGRPWLVEKGILTDTLPEL